MCIKVHTYKIYLLSSFFINYFVFFFQIYTLPILVMEHHLENFSVAASLGLSYVTDHVLDINWLLAFVLVALQVLEFLLSDEILV